MSDVEMELAELSKTGAPTWFVASHRMAFNRGDRQKKRIEKIEVGLTKTNQEFFDLKTTVRTLQEE
eukprot:7754511-Karenia_brevis.AAC.1